MKAFRTHSTIAIFAGFILLAGCKSSTTTSPANNTPVTKAGVGSTFVFTDIQKDSNNNVVSNTQETHTVLQNGTSYAGKSNVLVVGSTLSPGQQFYLNYESNGDISQFVQTSLFGNQGWITYPFASQSTLTSRSDTTIGSGASAQKITTSITMSGAGTSNITISGKSYVAERVHEVITFSNTTAGITTTSGAITQDLWFAPEIGYVVKSDSPSQKDLSGMSTGESTDTMDSFILK